MTELAYPSGIDCIWIASDVNSHLGVFVTAGVGPIPILALKEDKLAIENLEADICKLPPVSNVQLLVSLKRPDDFITLAERGFYVFDWQDIHRTKNEWSNKYELIAIPINPITLELLPETLRKWEKIIQFRNVNFMKENNFDVKSQIECCIP